VKTGSARRAQASARSCRRPKPGAEHQGVEERRCRQVRDREPVAHQVVAVPELFLQPVECGDHLLPRPLGGVGLAGAEPQPNQRAAIDAARPAQARGDGRPRPLRDGVEPLAVPSQLVEAEPADVGLYWHFQSKEDVFFALLEERIDARLRETVELLESAPPEQDMSVEASWPFAELVTAERELLLLEHEYWSQAVRDPRVRRRYVERRREMRAALGKALAVRFEHLGAARLGTAPEETATVLLSLAAGLAQQKLIEPDTVREELLGETIAAIYRGLVARAEDS
jgi:AcrR family transcriptional regulator